MRESFVHASMPARSSRRRWTRRAVELVSRFSRVAACGLALVVINGVIVVVAVNSHGFVPWLVLLGGLAWLNYEGIRRFRAWSAAREGNLLNEACHSLGAWLLSRGSAQPT